MRILALHLRNFRGFENFILQPNGHVVLMGEPRAGRSDLIEGLRRVLLPDSNRFPLSEPLDFFNGRVDSRAEVEAVLGDLGAELQQRFFDQLEVWNTETRQLVPELGEHDDLPDGHEVVVRLCYRAEWNSDEKQAQHWVDFPKFSDAEAGQFERVRRQLREALPFAALAPSTRPLELTARSTFRKVVEAAEGEDFPGSLDNFESGLVELAGELAKGLQVAAATDQVLEPIRPRLQLEKPASEILQFIPEGGSLGAIIRSLGPSIDLGEGVGPLPLSRHGSTLRTLFAVSEALYAAGASGGVVMADDFGEDMDSNAARYLAANLRSRSGQVWLATRRAAAAESFQLEELVRLTRSAGNRQVFKGLPPSTKAERLANQQLFVKILPEAASQALVFIEGADDRNGLLSLARRRFEEQQIPLPAAYSVSLVEASGITEIPKLSALSRQLGLHTVALIDHDGGGQEASDRVTELQQTCDAVIRLPEGFAIERALLHGLEDIVIVAAFSTLNEAFDLALPAAFFALTGAALMDAAIGRMKSSGLHAYFVDALPAHALPMVAAGALDEAVRAGASRATGLIQLGHI